MQVSATDENADDITAAEEVLYTTASNTLISLIMSTMLRFVSEEVIAGAEPYIFDLAQNKSIMWHICSVAVKWIYITMELP